MFSHYVKCFGNGLIATAVITGGLYFPALTYVWALLIGMALSGMSILLPLKNAAFRKSSQVFAVKEEKHSLIKLLGQIKFDSIFDSRSHEMQEGSILPAEFHNALQELEKYCKLKVDIKN